MFEVLGATCCLSLSENFHHSSPQFSTAAAKLLLEVHIMFMRPSEFIVRSFLNFRISLLSLFPYLILKNILHCYATY